MGNQQVVIPTIIILLSLLWAYPVLRVLQVSLVEKTIDGRIALLALGMHLVAVAALWHAHQYLYLLIYLSVTTLLWLLSPALSNIGEYAALRKLRNDDMQRYQRILEMDPRNAAAHAALADIYLERGQFDEAIAGYQQAIELHPDLARSERWKLEHAIERRDRRQGRRPQPIQSQPQVVATPVQDELQLEPVGVEEELPKGEGPKRAEEPPPGGGNWYDTF